MYQVTVFETPEELFRVIGRVRPIDDDTFVLPSSVYLVFDGTEVHFSGDGSERFALSRKLTQQVLIEAAFMQLGIKLHMT